MQRDLFVEWNLRLLQEFFSPASKDDEVFINVTPDVLDEIGPDIGRDEGFMRAVRRGPPWLRGMGLVPGLLALVDQRSARNLRGPSYVDPGHLDPTYPGKYPGTSAPTYLPYLAALVRCAAVAGPDGYYAQLRRDLDLPDTWGAGQMGQLQPVWKDLETWTDATRGTVGRFHVRRLGGYALIGIPKSQSILTRNDADRLPFCFHAAEVRVGQRLDEHLLDQIAAIAAEEGRLSTAFREAARDPGYREPVHATLAARFEEWDGTLPREQDGGTPDAASEVRLVLSLSPRNQLPWQVSFRVEEQVDSGSLKLRHEPSGWETRVAGRASAPHEERATASRVLASASHADVAFDTTLVDSDLEEADRGSATFRRRQLWILVGRTTAAQGWELGESHLPLRGGAYLLAPPATVPNLLAYFEREQPKYQLVDTQGLPEGWLLAYLEEQDLTDDQRSLPDGEGRHAAPHPIKLCGGKSVSRGGARQYLAYDLPTIELDAPPGAQLVADGLELQESMLLQPEGDESALPLNARIRTFRICQPKMQAGSYELRVVSEGTTLARTKLRIAAIVGDRVEEGSLLALDPCGNPQFRTPGLRGVLDASLLGAARKSAPLLVPLASVGGQVVGGARDWGTAELFLDSLARVGTMAYGQAKSQLERLSATAGGASPVMMLLELRSRGHIEIESTPRGHLARIHSVRPILYALPSACKEGTIYGVAGTLRLDHWQNLADLQNVALVREAPGSTSSRLWRVVAPNRAALEKEVIPIGFTVGDEQARALVMWGADFRRAWDSITGTCVESLGSNVEELEQFIPRTGLFKRVQSFNDTWPGPVCSLYRMLDPSTRQHRVYVLAVSGRGLNAPKYCFVRDSRWGIWLALAAFGRFLRDQYQIADAWPWPLTYDERTEDLWLPARISLPIPFERCLVMCNGGPPDSIDVSGISDGEALSLQTSKARAEVARASLVYEDMTPGRWLRYRWVPRDVVAALAAKTEALGANEEEEPECAIP